MKNNTKVGCTALLVLIVICLVIFGVWILSMREEYKDKHPILEAVRENFAKINPIYGTIPIKEGNQSYTENKRVITLCIKNPEEGGYYSINSIMYVALHELAHVVTKSQHHTDEFKRNFNKLLKKGAKLGVYNPSIPIPMTYCGVGPND